MQHSVISFHELAVTSRKRAAPCIAMVITNVNEHQVKIWNTCYLYHPSMQCYVPTMVAGIHASHAVESQTVGTRRDGGFSGNFVFPYFIFLDIALEEVVYV